jgi:hypothetical protein
MRDWSSTSGGIAAVVILLRVLPCRSASCVAACGVVLGGALSGLAGSGVRLGQFALLAGRLGTGPAAVPRSPVMCLARRQACAERRCRDPSPVPCSRQQTAGGRGPAARPVYPAGRPKCGQLSFMSPAPAPQRARTTAAACRSTRSGWPLPSPEPSKPPRGAAGRCAVTGPTRVPALLPRAARTHGREQARQNVSACCTKTARRASVGG